MMKSRVKVVKMQLLEPSDLLCKQRDKFKEQILDEEKGQNSSRRQSYKLRPAEDKS